MQIATAPITTLPVARPLASQPPVGVTKFGDLNVHYYLNGVVTKTYALDGPVVAPMSVKAASLADAVTAARHMFDLVPPSAIALTQGKDGAYFVHALNLDAEALAELRRPAQGPGYSWDVTNTSQGLLALVVGDKVIDFGKTSAR